MSFNFLGSPTTEEIDQLKEYLDGKYSLIDRQIRATDREIDRLRKLLVKLRASEGTIAAVTGKTVDQFALNDVVKAPIVDEDHTYFEQHKFDSSQTANLVDLLTKPWLDHIKRETETLEYKIKKTTYLIEMKTKQKQILIQLQAQITDET